MWRLVRASDYPISGSPSLLWCVPQRASFSLSRLCRHRSVLPGAILGTLRFAACDVPRAPFVPAAAVSRWTCEPLLYCRASRLTVSPRSNERGAVLKALHKRCRRRSSHRLPLEPTTRTRVRYRTLK
ncbi:hypothetical protein FA95DRAFT_756997 [Auriscalpium vulgare]|uniref:Uncharacterized protein n=1 Tax=Auriscalpium vulgare TaxID=40419 RepID=A0ACB8S263_9AGAM|nr:hypothetical protein FA95DRAFT_756997 [Auriscalpium vulgare]